MAEESREVGLKQDAVSTKFGRTEWRVVGVVVGVFLLAYVGVAFAPDWLKAVFRVSESGSDDIGKFSIFGPIGDFFGGIINPILTFFTICLLLQSLKLQRLELEATRFELTRTANANEELATLQRQQVMQSIESARSLKDAAQAQMLSAEAQKKLLTSQNISVLFEIYSAELSEVNNLIKRIEGYVNWSQACLVGNNAAPMVLSPFPEENLQEKAAELERRRAGLFAKMRDIRIDLEKSRPSFE